MIFGFMKNKKNNCKPVLFENSEITVIMNPIKLFLVLTAILCVLMLYAEDNNTYIKQHEIQENEVSSRYSIGIIL